MIHIFVLGHNGMLGNAVTKFFLQYPNSYKVHTTDHRWGEPAFTEELKGAKVDFIVNCIGAISQKYADSSNKYTELNIDLPIFLETLGVRVIHPSTDCEFSGSLPLGKVYTKECIRDATDKYGTSKAIISEKIENEFSNTKIIRVSIIGHEINTSNSLLEWVISEHHTPIKGYNDHYWNGITTLTWCQICKQVMEQWDDMPILNQFGTEKIASKYDLIKIILNVYNKNTVVEAFNTGKITNKCLSSDIVIPDIKTQLESLKKYYGK